MIGQLASGFNRGEMFGEAMPPHLETPYGSSEGLALASVVDGVANALLHGSHSAQRSDESFALEVLHDVVKALVFLTEDVPRGNAALVEEEFGRVRGQVADLLQLLADREALSLGWEHDQGDAFMAFAAGADCQNNEVTPRPIGDPKLLAGDNQFAAFDAGAGLNVRNVGSATWFADPERSYPFALHRARKEFGLLLFGAEFLDHGNGHIGLHQEGHVDAAAVGRAQRFDVSRGGPPVLAAAAPLGIDADAEHAQRAGFGEQLAREDAGFIPLRRVGSDFLFAELGHSLADEIVFLGEVWELSCLLRNGLRLRCRCHCYGHPPWIESRPTFAPGPRSGLT